MTRCRPDQQPRPLASTGCRFLVEGRELARWRGSAVGREAVGAPRFPAGVVLLRVRGPIIAPFPAPARQSVHAVLPHTAYRRRSPAVFGFSRQGVRALCETTIPYRPISPKSFGVKFEQRPPAEVLATAVAFAQEQNYAHPHVVRFSHQLLRL